MYLLHFVYPKFTVYPKSTLSLLKLLSRYEEYAECASFVSLVYAGARLISQCMCVLAAHALMRPSVSSDLVGLGVNSGLACALMQDYCSANEVQRLRSAFFWLVGLEGLEVKNL